MVLEAGDKRSSGVVEALSDLCQAYWYPLYSFVRRKGYDSAQAEDLTQSFFADLLEKDRLHRVEPTRGRFRSFLLTSLANFMKNQWRAENAIKRGGQESIVSIDFQDADARYNQQPTDELTPEKIFDRNWALSVLETSLAAVEQQYQASGKGQLFESLKPLIAGTGPIAYAELAVELGMKEGAIKVAVHRLRQRYADQLRLQIANTVDDPANVDEELQSLFVALQ